MPRSHTIRQVVENAWAQTFGAKAKLDIEAKKKVDAALRWFETELRPKEAVAAAAAAPVSNETSSIDWADEYIFGEISFSAQRVALFIRSMIKSPDVVVLDESFSGMDDAVRDKCTLFLTEGEAKTYDTSSRGRDRTVVESDVARNGNVRIHGLSEQQALICIAHVKEEVPDCVREWMCLPEANTGLPARFGRLEGPLRDDGQRWHSIWGVSES